MNNFQRFTATLTLAAIATTVSAQSTNTLSDTRMRDARVQAGIVIPFGSAGSKAERAPRLEMWSDHGSARQGAELRQQSDGNAVYGPPVRLGMTLGDQPRMIVNGREIPGQADRRNVSTLGWIAIGAGVIVVVGVGLIVAAGLHMNN